MHLSAIHENCSGCGVCRLTCALENHRLVNPALAYLKIEGRFPGPGDYHVHVCDECGACAEVCPVEAIGLSEGVLTIDTEECTACELCVDACPHNVLIAHQALDVPGKCTLCGACVEICPRQALVLQQDPEEEVA